MTAQLTTYPEYAASNGEWLGELPMHWEPRRARHLGVFSASGIDKKSVDSDVPVKMINYTDVYKSKSKLLSYSDTLMDTTAPAAKAYDHAVREGDILLTPSSETADDIGHAARAAPMPTAVVYSYHLLRFRVSACACPAYITYCFNSAPARAYFASVCAGTTRMVLSRGDFKNVPIALPPIDEQDCIAKFLDYETAKIDALIEKQQQLIALLKEKRQAVISHAVTKGLNPDAPMRDSGVEWLGEVPAHWAVARINKFAHKITNGYVGPTRGLFVDSGVKYLQSLHIKNNRVVFTPPYYVTPEWSATKKKSILKEGDVLIVQTGDIGQSACVPAELAGANCHALIVVATNQAIMSGPYLSWCLNSDYGCQSLKSIQTGALHPHLNCGTVKYLPIPVPPMEEQLRIVEQVEAERTRYDKLQLAGEDQITLLQERRTALISAAVTGKIDVRGWKAPESQPEADVA